MKGCNAQCFPCLVLLEVCDLLFKKTTFTTEVVHVQCTSSIPFVLKLGIHLSTWLRGYDSCLNTVLLPVSRSLAQVYFES